MLEVSSSVNKWRTEGDKKDGKGNTRGHRKSEAVAVMSQGLTKNTDVLELGPWHPIKPVHRLQHFPTTLPSWADTPTRRKKSGVILTILSRHFTKPRHTRQLTRKSAVLYPHWRWGRRENGFDLNWAVLSLPSSLAWGSSWNRRKTPTRLGHKRPAASGTLNAPPRRLAMKPESAPPSLLTARGRHVLSLPRKGM